MVFLKHLHIIKRNLNLLKNSILVVLFGILSFSKCTIFAQSDTQIQRNFSDSITKSCQIVISIPQLEQKWISPFIKIKKDRIHYTEYQKLAPQILYHLERNGYPFASVFLDSISTIRDTVHFVLRIDRSRFVQYDTILLKGNLKLSNSFLRSYLSFKKGKKYHEGNIQNIQKKIEELPFVIEKQTLGVDFIEDKALLILFLDSKKVNQFDGIIGFAPRTQTDQRLGFTGELKLQLINTLQLAETFKLHWQAPESYSQLLDINTQFNYLFNTPFGTDGSFHLDKKDTTYLKMNSLLSINYSFRGNNHIKTFIDYTFSNLLQSELNSENNLYTGFSKTMYGIALNYRKLDFIFNPSKGIQVYIQGSAGNIIPSNNTASEQRYSGLIDGKGYIPIYKRFVMVLGVKSGFLSGKKLYKNEFYRLGGMNSLQGFDELSIYANKYLFGLFEIRYKLSRMSYINGFFNGGWYEQDLETQYFTDTPYGFGIGFAFETRAGIFNLSYALGSQQGNPISFKTGKVHFGIAVQF